MMRSRDKRKNIEEANKRLEEYYLQSKIVKKILKEDDWVTTGSSDVIDDQLNLEFPKEISNLPKHDGKRYLIVFADNNRENIKNVFESLDNLGWQGGYSDFDKLHYQIHKTRKPSDIIEMFLKYRRDNRDAYIHLTPKGSFTYGPDKNTFEEANNIDWDTVDLTVI